MRWAILLVALALVAAACSNGGGGSSDDKAEAPTKRGGLEQRKIAEDGDDAMAPTPAASPSPETTATANGQPVTGRQLLQASRARFTRPLPTVVPTPVTTTVPVPPTTPPTIPPDGTDPVDPPTAREEIPSQELIAKALAAGEITWEQSLLYRAYALFWDPRLPEKFDGVGSLGEDDFFTEARERFADIHVDIQAELAPFLERPTAAEGYGCPVSDDGQPATWEDSGAASAHFKVWACSTGDAAGDVAEVAAILDDVYPAMSDPAAMGPALPDAGTPDDGGDPRIDVYLLDVVPTRLRGGVQAPIEGLPIAALSADDPFVGAAASSYLMIGRPRLSVPGELRRTLVHEVFHAQQYAHNYAIATVEPTATPWFFEASAAWAERQFFPAAAARVHDDYFTDGFGTAPDFPLELPTRAAGTAAEMAHPRWAYLWPFFMQQEAGGDPAAVFDTWDALDGAATWDEFHGAIDAQLPFATAFRDFTVRNLNRDLGPAIGPLYRDLDPAFPTGATPELNGELSITDPGTVTQAVGGPSGPGLRSLASQYDEVLVTERSNTRTLRFDFTGIPKGIDVTVLTRAPDGTWTRHDLAPADVLTLDFDTTGDVDQAYVILGNHEREANWAKPGGGVLGGSYTITAAG